MWNLLSFSELLSKLSHQNELGPPIRFVVSCEWASSPAVEDVNDKHAKHLLWEKMKIIFKHMNKYNLHSSLSWGTVWCAANKKKKWGTLNHCCKRFDVSSSLRRCTHQFLDKSKIIMDLTTGAISSPERHKNPGHGFLSRLENRIILGGFQNKTC